MTSSVPYSFVPGTKAKADEVNANFIAVLDKIEQVNSDTKSTLSTELNKKADKSEIDGNWVSDASYIAQSIIIGPDYNHIFDLSEILPDDGEVYEIIVNASIRTGTTVNNALELLAASTICRGTYLCRAVTRIQNVNQIASGSAIIPIAADRKINFLTGATTNADCNSTGCTFKISAYRKAR